VGVTELSNILGIDKSVVSRLVKKGMPTNSVDAAQAWRETNAPPRAKRGQRGETPPAPKRAPAPAPEPMPYESPLKSEATPKVKAKQVAIESANTPELSLQRAIQAEDAAHQKRKEIEINNGSIEDYRKANAVYIASRNNRVKAQKDFADWQQSERITIYSDNAIEMFQRTLGAGRQLIDVMPKTLAVRLVNQPQKEIERTLLEWCSRLIETMRANVWPKRIEA